MVFAPVASSEPRPYPRGFGAVGVVRRFGLRLAYFPRTGDLARVGEPVADALAGWQEDLPWWELRRRLVARHGRAAASAALRDVIALLRQGLLAPDAPVGPEARERFTRALLGTRPRRMMFLVTEACNLRCTYCYEVASGFHDAARRMSPEHARAIVDGFFRESAGRGSLELTFFGGEPLLNFPVVRAATLHAEARAAELGVEVGFSITTNLTLLTPEIAGFLVEHRFGVMVSLDGDRAGNDAHRVTRSGAGTYDAVVANLRVLLAEQRAAGVRPARIRATMTAENSDARAIEEHLRGLGTELVMVGEAHGTAQSQAPHDLRGPAAEAAEARLDADVEAWLRALASGPDPERRDLERLLADPLRKVHQEATRREPAAGAPPALCGVCRNMKAVTPTGDLYPCHRYAGMSPFRLGNAFTGGADADKVRAYYGSLQEVFERKCRGCWARVLCGGQCPWYLSTPEGELGLPDEAGCRSIRAGLGRALALYSVLAERHPEVLQRMLRAEAADPPGHAAARPAACSR